MMLWWFFSGIQTEARAVKDYRPISLIDSFGKLMSKVLANQLATRIGDLVRCTHRRVPSLPGRTIQDSFKTV
jgi:hypothetical protein